jgi:hypothetical protein
MQLVFQQWPVRIIVRPFVHSTGIILGWPVDCSECGPIGAHTGEGSRGSAANLVLAHLEGEHSDLTGIIFAHVEEAQP